MHASQDSLVSTPLPNAAEVDGASTEQLRKMIADYQANLAAKDVQIVTLEEEKQEISNDFAS